AWRAASARPTQVSSLEDPMLGVQAGPAAFGSNQVNGGYRIEVSQKCPWPGKLDLRGRGALAEAKAAGDEVEDARLQLKEAAKDAFYDYYLADRALEINRKNLDLLRNFREEAEVRYTNKKGSRQDILQADVEMGQQRERQITLERARAVAV